MLTKRALLGSAVAVAAGVTKPGRLLAQTNTSRPGFFKAKDIAEEGFSKAIGTSKQGRYSIISM